LLDLKEMPSARELATKWNWSSLLLFEAIVCTVSMAFSVAGSIAPQIVLTVPASGLSLGSNTVLLLLGSLVPGVALFAVSKECRSATLRLRASIRVHITALLFGFALPFSSYLGARFADPLWNSSTVPTLVRVFMINLLLSPLWEEVIWRAYFYPKVNSMLQTAPAIVVASMGWSFWHLGFLFYLYHSGIGAIILMVLAIRLFFGGIILCSFFTVGRNSLAPCVLLHTAFNASTAAYFGSYSRVNDIGSYVAETVFTIVVAIIMFRLATRAGARRSSGPVLA
jgi:membrane protease YdiL (CAAX protease family)